MSIRSTIRSDLMGQYARWKALAPYQQFEEVIVWLLGILIAVVIVGAMWSLAMVVMSFALLEGFDPTNHAAFQDVFGAIFTVMIALEFKRSLVVVAERQRSLVQVRAVILIALLAVLRKLIIIDVTTTDAGLLWALAAATLALGAVYWLVRDQDRRDRTPSPAAVDRAS